MNVKETLVKQPVQKEPTLEQLKQMMQQLRAEADELKQENTALRAEIETLKEEKETQSQRIYQLHQEILKNALGEVDDSNQQLPPEQRRSETPITVSVSGDGVEGRELSKWKKKIQHPAAPFVAWGTLMGTGLLSSSSIRADIAELGQAAQAASAILNEVISGMTAATPFPEISAMLIQSLLIAAVGIAGILIVRWLVYQIRSHYNRLMKTTIAAFPILPIVLSALHDSFQNVNCVLVMLVMQIVFIILQVLPKEKSAKLKKPKRILH